MMHSVVIVEFCSDTIDSLTLGQELCSAQVQPHAHNGALWCLLICYQTNDNIQPSGLVQGGERLAAEVYRKLVHSEGDCHRRTRHITRYKP